MHLTKIILILFR